MSDETYVLAVFLRSGQILRLRMTKDQALIIAEGWATYSRQKYGQINFTSIPFVGGIGWGVAFPDVSAIYAEPVPPPEPPHDCAACAERLKLTQQATDIQRRLLKIMEKEADQGDEWKESP